ncbi:MAG: hypothetical protein QOF24_305 [Verrucomicrobiota bacterium]
MARIFSLPSAYLCDPRSERLRQTLTFLLRSSNRGNAVSREALLNEVWGVDYYGTTRTLDQLIVKLRRKIEDVPGEPRHLLTVHTLGYRLED